MNLSMRKLLFLGLAPMALLASMFSSCNNNAATEQEIVELQARYDSIMTQYETLRKDGESFSDEMRVKDSTITAQAAEIQSLIQQLRSANQRRQPVAATSGSEQELKSQIDAQKAEIKSQKSLLKEKEALLNRLHKQIDKQAEELEALKLAAANADNNASDASNIDGTIVKQREQIAQQNSQIAQLNSQINDLNGRISNMNTQIAAIHSQNETLTGDNTKLKSENAALRADLSQLTSANNSLTSEINALKSQVSALNSQLSNLKSQLDAAGKGESSNNDAVIAQYQSQIESLQADVKRLTAAVAAVELEKNAEIEALKQLKNKLQKDNEELVTANRLLEGEKNALILQNRQLTENQSGNKAADAQIAQMTAKVAELESKVAQMTNQAAAINQQLKEKDAQIEALMSQQAASGDANTQYSEMVSALQAQVESQKTEIEQLQATVKTKESELAQANQALNEAKSTISQLQNAASRPAPTNKNAVSQKLSELQSLCDNYAAEIERLRAENEMLRSENSQLREDMTNLQKNAGKAIEENAKLIQKVAQASILVTSDMKAQAGKGMAGGNAIKPTTKAKDTKLIRLECRLLDNNVVDPGTITLYARIANAANRVVSNGNPETFDLAGISMQYTMKQDIEFTGYGRNVTMIWKKADMVDLPAGLYWVTLYANGSEIGKTSLTLK